MPVYAKINKSRGGIRIEFGLDNRSLYMFNLDWYAFFVGLMHKQRKD